MHAEEFPDEVDLSLPTTAETRVSNGRLSLHFIFKGPMQLDTGLGKWTDREVEPFKLAGERWLEIVKGPAGGQDFEMKVYVQVKPYEDGLAVASPHFESIVEMNGHFLAREGETVVASYNYTQEYLDELEYPEDAEEEFIGTIMHELGHVAGIGTLWNLTREDGEIVPDDESPGLRNWARSSPKYGGPYYQQPAALRGYREAFGDWEFVPLLNERGHVFFEDDDNPPRKTADGRSIPSADEELMGDGIYFTSISAGFLQDLGWAIDSSTLDEYPE